MLNAHAIYRLLLDDELPPPEQPAEPEFSEDPEAALNRYVQGNLRPHGITVDLYQRWSARLSGRRVYRYPTLGSTWLEKIDDGLLGLRYHETHVVTVTRDNHVTFNSDGWLTRKTLERINMADAGGWKLFGKKPRNLAHDKWTFYWCNPFTKQGAYDDNKLLPYTDGDQVLPDGTLVLQATPVYKV